MSNANFDHSLRVPGPHKPCSPCRSSVCAANADGLAVCIRTAFIVLIGFTVYDM